MNADRIARIIAGIAGLFFVAFGLWAFFDPVSFYDSIAEFPPYNRHFLHDIGAFQIGLGAVLLAAAVWPASALFAALLGTTIGAGSHAAAHIHDHDLGGADTDVPFFLLLTVVLAAGAALARPRPAGSNEA